MRIAADARTLTRPTTSIGRYTASKLSELGSVDHTLLLYAHRPFDAFAESPGFTIRTGQHRENALSTLFARASFARWAKRDHANLFWSPHDHLLPSVATIHDTVWKRHADTMIRLGWTMRRC